MHCCCNFKFVQHLFNQNSEELDESLEESCYTHSYMMGNTNPEFHSAAYQDLTIRKPCYNIGLFRVDKGTGGSRGQICLRTTGGWVGGRKSLCWPQLIELTTCLGKLKYRNTSTLETKNKVIKTGKLKTQQGRIGLVTNSLTYFVQCISVTGKIFV